MHEGFYTYSTSKGRSQTYIIVIYKHTHAHNYSAHGFTQVGTLVLLTVTTVALLLAGGVSTSDDPRQLNIAELLFISVHICSFVSQLERFTARLCQRNKVAVTPKYHKAANSTRTSFEFL